MIAPPKPVLLLPLLRALALIAPRDKDPDGAESDTFSESKPLSPRTFYPEPSFPVLASPKIVAHLFIDVMPLKILFSRMGT